MDSCDHRGRSDRPHRTMVAEALRLVSAMTRCIQHSISATCRMFMSSWKGMGADSPHRPGGHGDESCAGEDLPSHRMRPSNARCDSCPPSCDYGSLYAPAQAISKRPVCTLCVRRRAQQGSVRLRTFAARTFPLIEALCGPGPALTSVDRSESFHRRCAAPLIDASATRM